MIVSMDLKKRPKIVNVSVAKSYLKYSSFHTLILVPKALFHPWCLLLKPNRNDMRTCSENMVGRAFQFARGELLMV